MRAHILIKFVFAFLALAMSFGAQAADQRASKDEAVAMVKKAIDYLRQNGKEKAFAEFSKPQGVFVDRELYVVVEDMTGTVLAHGTNPKLIGKNLMEIKDMNGKAFVREQVEVAKTKGSGWVEYLFAHPTTQQIKTKASYLERFDDVVITCGCYT